MSLLECRFNKGPLQGPRVLPCFGPAEESDLPGELEAEWLQTSCCYRVVRLVQTKHDSLLLRLCQGFMTEASWDLYATAVQGSRNEGDNDRPNGSQVDLSLKKMSTSESSIFMVFVR